LTNIVKTQNFCHKISHFHKILNYLHPWRQNDLKIYKYIMVNKEELTAPKTDGDKIRGPRNIQFYCVADEFK
jgi:hypothetical protein